MTDTSCCQFNNETDGLNECNRVQRMNSPPRISSTLVGAAGEHFVMFQLYRRGIMVGQPPQNVANVDLLDLDEDTAARSAG